MKVQCEYCNSWIDDTDEKCPNCGGVNKVYKRATDQTPKTIEELKQLISTECKYEIMKQAFLFSCLCGLRVSDIRKLKWSDLQKSGERIRIEIKMQKTKEPLYLPIGKSSVSCPLKPSDSAPLKHSTMPP